jgi:hypothetical protein
MSSQNEIIVGVISGILTSAILFIAARFFQNTVLPAIRQLVYQGIDVSGSWYWENRFETVAKMELKQSADRLSGTFTYVNAKRAIFKSFSVKGQIQDRFIQLILQSNDHQKLGVLSYVFEVVGDGTELRGFSSFYATNSHKIASEQESFFRDATIAKKLAQEEKIDLEKFFANLSIATKSPPETKIVTDAEPLEDDSKPQIVQPTT